MAVKFGIRNYSRTGNQVTFTLVALNADGTIDTNYTGTFTWGLAGMTDPGTPQFTAGDLGQRTYTTTISNPDIRAGLAANFPGAGTGANLSVSGPNGTNVSFGNQGDHLLVGGAGNDTLNGNNGNDLFLLQQGGNETVGGGAGDDGFYFGSTYTVADIVNGGAGARDQVGLQGNYSGGVTFGSLLGVELIVLLPGNDVRFGDTANNSYDYNLVADASTVVSDNRLTIQANSLRAGEDFTFNGSATSIDFLIYGGNGADNLTGGSGNDGFFFGQGRFGLTDVINGGGGQDQLGLQGNFTGANALGFGSGQLTSVEFIVLLSASDNRFGASGGSVSYDLTLDDSNVAANQLMTVQANSLRAGETLSFNGAFETNGNFRVYGGSGNDFIVGGQNTDEIWGGAGNDFIRGSGGGDLLRGGAGNDTFAYVAISDSPPSDGDQILDFALGDKISFAALAANTGGGNFTLAGENGPTGARQIYLVQAGVNATLFVYLDADNNHDMMIDVTVLGGHTLGIGDLIGVSAMQQFEQPKQDYEGVGGGAALNIWGQDASGAVLYRLGDPDLIDVNNALHALPSSSDLLI